MYFIGFSKKTTFVAKAIMFLTNSTVSHTYIRQDLATNIKYVFESDERGVNIQWWRVFYRESSHNIIVEEYKINLPDELLLEAWSTTQDQHLNRKYGYLQLVGDAIAIIAGWIFKRKFKNPLGNAHTVVCSELVLAFLVNAGIPGFSHFDPETVSPEDLLDVVRDMPATFERV